jgi:hypothetical protein
VPVSQFEIPKRVCDLNPGNPAGIDGSSSTIVREILSAVILPLQHIINLSFKTGVFPSAFKAARIIPLHKGDSPENPSNYRPVSILSAFYKYLRRQFTKGFYDLSSYPNKFLGYALLTMYMHIASFDLVRISPQYCAWI